MSNLSNDSAKSGKTEMQKGAENLKSQDWHYPDMKWRAVNSDGSAAYHQQEPEIIRDSYWMHRNINSFFMPTNELDGLFDATDWRNSKQHISEVVNDEA